MGLELGKLCEMGRRGEKEERGNGKEERTAGILDGFESTTNAMIRRGCPGFFQRDASLRSA